MFGCCLAESHSALQPLTPACLPAAVCSVAAPLLTAADVAIWHSAAAMPFSLQSACPGEGLLTRLQQVVFNMTQTMSPACSLVWGCSLASRVCTTLLHIQLLPMCPSLCHGQSPKQVPADLQQVGCSPLTQVASPAAVCAAAEAHLHGCVQQHGQRAGAEGPDPPGSGVLQCGAADQPQPRESCTRHCCSSWPSHSIRAAGATLLVQLSLRLLQALLLLAFSLMSS